MRRMYITVVRYLIYRDPCPSEEREEGFGSGENESQEEECSAAIHDHELTK